MFGIKILYNDLYYISVVSSTCWYHELSTKREFLHKATLWVSHTDLTHVNTGSNFSTSLLLHLITPSPLTANSLLSLLKCLLTENPRSVGLSTFFNIAFLNTRHHYWIHTLPQQLCKVHCLSLLHAFPPLVSFQVFLLVLQYKQDLSRFKLHFVFLSLLDILVSLD